MTQYNHPQRGFTLVELSLALSFIAILLLAIAVLTIQISAIYTKGLTIKQVNDAGTVVSSDIQRTFSVARASSVDRVIRPDKSGRICVGPLTYAWNSGEAFIANNYFNRYALKTDTVRMVKFAAQAGASPVGVVKYCEPDINGVYPLIPDDATEMVAISDRELVIQELDFAETPVAGNQTIYNFTMRIGTNGADVISGTRCSVPNTKDDQYCAVNQFNFVARVGSAEE